MMKDTSLTSMFPRPAPYMWDTPEEFPADVEAGRGAVWDKSASKPGVSALTRCPYPPITDRPALGVTRVRDAVGGKGGSIRCGEFLEFCPMTTSLTSKFPRPAPYMWDTPEEFPADVEAGRGAVWDKSASKPGPLITDRPALGATRVLTAAPDVVVKGKGGSIRCGEFLEFCRKMKDTSLTSMFPRPAPYMWDTPEEFPADVEAGRGAVWDKSASKPGGSALTRCPYPPITDRPALGATRVPDCCNWKKAYLPEILPIHK
jgi:hypothetical protein